MAGLPVIYLVLKWKSLLAKTGAFLSKSLSSVPSPILSRDRPQRAVPAVPRPVFLVYLDLSTSVRPINILHIIFIFALLYILCGILFRFVLGRLSMATSTPRAGLQVVVLPDFMDIWNKHRLSWMRPFKPVGHIAREYLIFDITPDQIRQYYAHPSPER